MNTLTITPSEVQAGCLEATHRRAAVEAVMRWGYVVLKDVVDTAHVEVLWHRMLEDVEQILSRDEVPTQFTAGHLQQDPPPFAPFLFRDVLLNDLVIDVTEGVLGRGVKNTFYSGNTNLPGSETQPVHADIGQLWPNLEHAHPAYGLVVNVPVVDMGPENGSTELWPGTHLDTSIAIQDGNIRVAADRLAAQRAVAAPVQPVVHAGDVLIRDVRMWHRGMTNRSDRPRPMIAMIHNCAWWKDAQMPFPKGTESFFRHDHLETCAVFVDEPIDYIGRTTCFDVRQ